MESKDLLYISLEVFDMEKNNQGYSFVNGRQDDGTFNVPNKEAEDWYKETLKNFIDALSDLKWSGLDIVLGSDVCFSMFCRVRALLNQLEEEPYDVDYVKDEDGYPQQTLVIRDDEDRFPYKISPMIYGKEED